MKSVYMSVRISFAKCVQFCEGYDIHVESLKSNLKKCG